MVDFLRHGHIYSIHAHFTRVACLFIFLPHFCICQERSAPLKAAKPLDKDEDPRPPSLALPQEPLPSLQVQQQQKPTDSKQLAAQDVYDVQVVNDTGAYDCLICQLIPRDPMQVSCCGKRFCRTCITRVLSDRNVCPHCQAKGDTIQAFEDQGQRQTILEVKIYCPSKKKGCSWIGELYHLDTHLNSNPVEGSEGKGCLYAELTCVYCTERYPRHLRYKHIRRCQLQPYTCPYCKHRITCYRYLTDRHVTECEMSCPFCDEKVPRIHLHLHKTECLQRKHSQGISYYWNKHDCSNG